ncbi:WbqC family protein [Dysgonomonas sp. BGC7]|uniref:WbqC family protein n=1 Tax=Dysgonomonas sp. BGC7 TaxID=1658008 RepID=UPI000680FB55|nr:WbqC family protein [Dysgonomonas sp. BGC7]MBD8388150.1 WbqC family protein [Dysgonomonas sp. BGC7]
MEIYLSSTYLGPVQYYSKFLTTEKIYIERYENYIKQTYRNRCVIVSANGPITLSIPVIHSSGDKTLIKDVRIADHGNWQHMHWNAIVSAYNSTPFFEYYQDDFHSFYHNKFNFLFDFNEALRELILNLLNIEVPEITYTDKYKERDSGYEDWRELINPKKDWRLLDSKFREVPYYQVFIQKFGFIPNMSIIDLLFNMGNEAQLVLDKSTK